MSDSVSSVRAFYWEDGGLMLLDQRLLPHRLEYVRCASVVQVIDAIQTMIVRGAPAIGIAAAYGVVLAASSAFDKHGKGWRVEKWIEGKT